MDTEQNTFTYSPSKTEKGTDKRSKRQWDFLTPFVVFSFLVAPTLVILAFAKSTVSFQALTVQAYFPALLTILWILVPLAVVFGALHIWKGGGALSKLLVMTFLLVVVASFVYVILPA